LSLLKHRRKRRFTPACHLKVNETVYRTQEEKLDVWSKYFCDLYSEDNCNELYDSHHEKEINMAVSKLKCSSRYESDDIIVNPFTTEEIAREISGLKCGKNGGFDNLTNEHLKYGGGVLVQCLTNLFNAIYDI
jgi:hypothetical protein